MTAHNWISELPTSPFGSLAETITLAADIQNGTNMWNCFHILRTLIHRLNSQILYAKTGDEIAVAEARQKLLVQEHERRLVRVRKSTLNLLMKGGYICSGLVNGENVIVPIRAWSGDVDWEKETLFYAGQKYSCLRIITRGLLSEVQQKLVREYASGDAEKRITCTGAPGRPSSMHIVVAELRRRIAANATELSTRAESKHLAEWFKREHPDKPPLKAKSISNHIGGLMREHLSVFDTGSELPQKRA